MIGNHLKISVQWYQNLNTHCLSNENCGASSSSKEFHHILHHDFQSQHANRIAAADVAPVASAAQAAEYIATASADDGDYWLTRPDDS